MTSPEQIQTSRRNAALSSKAGAAWAGFAVLSAAWDRKLDRLAHHAGAKIQANPEKIGFVSQKHIKSQARDLCLPYIEREL
jgi:hypothetical protein